MSSEKHMTRDQLLEALKIVRDVLVQAPKSCINCMHFNESEECILAKPPSRPPAAIIARGCKMWTDDGSVPF